jgi:anaerobic ribonucleoside-triphosphate reductase
VAANKQERKTKKITKCNISKNNNKSGGIGCQSSRISGMEDISMNTEKKMNVGQDVRFERIRRITGYLVGTMDKWNDAKKAEEHDRVKHGLGRC